MKRPVLIGLVLLLSLNIQSSKTAILAQCPSLDWLGTLNGVPYKIRVPTTWNGTLVVYAHGYYPQTDQPEDANARHASAAPTGNPFEGMLLSRGYALAGSAYAHDGWAVKEGIEDTLALTKFFKDQIGQPRHTILWGFSMGSVIALKSIEEFPDVYDGVIAACSVGAGAPRAWDAAADMALAYDVTFGWPACWGRLGEVRDDLNFETDVAPTVLRQVSNRANAGRFEFIRLVNHLPAQNFYSGFNWLMENFFFATEGRAELERRAGGSVVQNLTHVYTLTAAEKSYLASLGVNADAWLAAMNAKRTLAALPSARRYLEHYARYSGNITRPVLTIHNTVDGLALPANESAYKATVEAMGKQEYVVQVFTNAVGHCVFTPRQLISALEAMESWLDTGVPPGPEFFPEGMGFVPNFAPPLWPQP